ncbi:MAG: hypothetical protein KDC53_14005 [Saprospiraceae bacterium]|nr:hypothetical protein [Saprospiraceae bacterium]
MENTSKSKKIGRLLKTFGTHGQLRCQIQDDFLSLLKKDRYIWAAVDGLPVPLQIEEISKQHKPLIRIKDIRTERQASILSGSWIYLIKEDVPKSLWPEREGDDLMFSYLRGYQVKFLNSDLTGTVNDIRQYPGQEMAFIALTDEREIMLPLVEEFIVKVDEDLRHIQVQVPDGFLDL